MYPYLLPDVFGYVIPLYDVMIVIGVFLMLVYIIKKFDTTDGFSKKQTNRLLILIMISLVFALISSFLVDGIFHSIEEGELTFGSISFLGGLIGGVASFLLLLKYFYKDENKDVRKIMSTVITGVVLAHAFGRIGCFFAGCCYGIPTDSFLGVVFPGGHAHLTYGDASIFPTQLFEAFFLFVLFGLMNKVELFKNNKIETYMFGYGVWRIMLEFIRGDNRGVFLPLFETAYNVYPTPSQFMSLLMILIGVALVVYRKYQNNKLINT
ncbi:prolipoprotein diacylglyceryl transferase [Candidatus Izimaplasma bacterium]|nr:prolipoprotein diacylglyceryl transferase [Candidatus Izimaplasma bacterium]